MHTIPSLQRQCSGGPRFRSLQTPEREGWERGKWLSANVIKCYFQSVGVGCRQNANLDFLARWFHYFSLSNPFGLFLVLLRKLII